MGEVWERRGGLPASPGIMGGRTGEGEAARERANGKGVELCGEFAYIGRVTVLQ